MLVSVTLFELVWKALGLGAFKLIEELCLLPQSSLLTNFSNIIKEDKIGDSMPVLICSCICISTPLST